MKSVAAAFMTVRDANQIDGMPMSLNSSKVRFTLCGNTIDALPRCTGIYRFLGEQDPLLYIGKSVNVYSRVRCHFARSGQGDRQRRMIHATRTVDCRPTAGEAGALLLENAAMKKRKYRNLYSPKGSRMPEPGDRGPSWLTAIGRAKDSLWSIDLFRYESIVLKSLWVMVVMDQCTRRIIGFAVHDNHVDGPALLQREQNSLCSQWCHTNCARRQQCRGHP